MWAISSVAQLARRADKLTIKRSRIGQVNNSYKTEHGAHKEPVKRMRESTYWVNQNHNISLSALERKCHSFRINGKPCPLTIRLESGSDQLYPVITNPYRN